MNFSDNYGADPNYVGSSLQPTPFYQDVKGTNPQALSTLTEHEKWVGEVSSFQTHITDEDFEQPAALWKVIGKEPGHQERFFGNIACHLGKVKSARLRRAVYGKLPNSFDEAKPSLTSLIRLFFSNYPRPGRWSQRSL